MEDKKLTFLVWYDHPEALYMLDQPVRIALDREYDPEEIWALDEGCDELPT